MARSSCLTLKGVRFRNLKNINVRIPLGQLVCVTGVSGSGKTTLVREILYPSLHQRLMRSDAAQIKASDRMGDKDETDSEDLLADPEAMQFRLEGWEALQGAVLVDQSVLGKTPRSNPAVYTGAFDHIRELFARTDEARQRGLNASAFSFNSAQGQCERCRGAGFEKIEMQFLSDVFIRCPDCEGRRYREHILKIKITPPECVGYGNRDRSGSRRQAWSIGDMLEATVDEALDFLGGFGDLPAGKRARQSLALLQEVGLGYLKLGQPINTLSGGESQRLKLVREMSSVDDGESIERGRTLFLFDEPTTGLHFEDVRVLTNVFRRLVRSGHSVLVIEHNLDLIRAADWIIDLGPEAGDDGGRVVVEGTPSQVAACPTSHTGAALRESTLSRVEDEQPALATV